MNTVWSTPEAWNFRSDSRSWAGVPMQPVPPPSTSRSSWARKAEGADAELRREVNGLAIRAGDPQRGMRLLHRLGQDIAHGHGEILALKAGVGVHHHHVGDLLDGLPPHGPSVRGGDAEALQLSARRRLARAELHASLGAESA